jgi:hypothetical protein
MYKEFVDCNSQYHISDKDSDEISSDGEFIDAGRILDY